MGNDFLYKFEGKIYSWLELINKLYKDYWKDEKKKKWWKREQLDIDSYSLGFSKGMNYGVKLISEIKNNEIIDNTSNNTSQSVEGAKK